MPVQDTDHKVAQIIKGLEQRIADLEEKDQSATTPNLLRTQQDQTHVADSLTNVDEQAIIALKWNDVDITPHIRGYGMLPYGRYGYGAAIYDPRVDGTDDTTTGGTDSDGYGLFAYNTVGYGAAETNEDVGYGTPGYGEYGYETDDGYDATDELLQYGEGGFGEGGYGEGQSSDDSGDDTDDGDYAEGGYTEGGYGGVEPTMWEMPGNSGWGTGTWGSYGSANGTLTVDSGQTYTIPSGDTERYAGADVDGTVEADGTLETTN